MDKSTRILLTAIAAAAMTSGAYAQALSDGVPSDASNFADILNVSTPINPGVGSNLGDPSGVNLTQINLSVGGDIADNQVDYHYVEFNIDGGLTGTSEDYFNSEINLISGELNFHSNIHANSILNVSGGTFHANWDLHGTANMNGGLTEYGYVKSGGTLNFNAGTAVTSGSAGLDIESGGTLNLSGGTIGSTADLLLGSTFNMTGGSIGNNLNLGGIAHISGGTIGSNVDAENGSVVTITDGTFGTGFNAKSGSVVNISGGTHNTSFDAENGSIVNVSGGTFGTSFNPNSGSDVTITGGTFDNYFLNEGVTDISGGTFGVFRNFTDSEVNFFGTSFTLDGIDLGEGTHIIGVRDVNLSGFLIDGSAIDFDLTAVSASPVSEWFDAGSVVTVTVIPEPGSLALLGLGGLMIARRRRLA